MSIFNCCDPSSDTIENLQINIVAPPGQTTIVDTLELTKYDAIQWNIVVVDSSQNKRRFQTINATHELNINAFHNEFSGVGSKRKDFDYILDVDINLGLFRLKITNNSLVDYILEVIRIPVEIFTPTP